MRENRRTDLAKGKALPDLLLSAPLGGVTTQIPSGPSRTKKETTNETQQRSTAGGSATTIQLKLHPKAQKSTSISSLEDRPEDVELFGSESDALHSSSLQPADEGFGAWSYVASAFAMFVIVWGIDHALLSSKGFECSTLADPLCRVSRSVSGLSDLSIQRALI